MAKGLHLVGAVSSTFFALAFAGCTVLTALHGVSSCKYAAVVVFFGTKTAFFMLLAQHYFRAGSNRMPVALVVNASGYFVVGGLILVSAILQEVSPHWTFAAVLALCLGAAQMAAVHRMRSTATKKPA